jgi:hypothetical protein
MYASDFNSRSQSNDTRPSCRLGAPHHENSCTSVLDKLTILCPVVNERKQLLRAFVNSRLTGRRSLVRVSAPPCTVYGCFCCSPFNYRMARRYWCRLQSPILSLTDTVTHEKSIKGSKDFCRIFHLSHSHHRHHSATIRHFLLMRRENCRIFIQDAKCKRQLV